MHSDGLLVDTDVVSFVASNRSQAAAFVPLLQGKLLAVSFVTVGEMFLWCVKGEMGRLENR